MGAEVTDSAQLKVWATDCVDGVVTKNVHQAGRLTLRVSLVVTHWLKVYEGQYDPCSELVR